MKDFFFPTTELSFTDTLTLFIPPDDNGAFIVPDSIEAVVKKLDGSVVTTPTISLGIAGNTVKYLNAVPLSQLTALHSAHRISTLASSEGADELVLTLAPEGVVSAGGTYTGQFVIRGIQG